MKEPTMSRPPAFQFYPDKWQSHTRRLSDQSYRVYHEMLCWMWLHSPDFCSIPNNNDAIACLLSVSADRINQALFEIQNIHAPLLRVEGDKLVSNGLRKVHEHLQERRDKAVMAINTRWKKAKRTKYKRNTDVTIEKYTPTITSTPSPIPTHIVNKDCHDKIVPAEIPHHPAEIPHHPALKRIEEKGTEEKQKHGETGLVLLTSSEHSALKASYGSRFDRAVEVLDSYLGSSGKKYKSHYHVMRKGNWLWDKIHQEQQQSRPANDSMLIDGERSLREALS